jgi:hypothetical protein
VAAVTLTCLRRQSPPTRPQQQSLAPLPPLEQGGPRKRDPSLPNVISIPSGDVNQMEATVRNASAMIEELRDLNEFKDQIINEQAQIINELRQIVRLMQLPR